MNLSLRHLPYLSRTVNDDMATNPDPQSVLIEGSRDYAATWAQFSTAHVQWCEKHGMQPLTMALPPAAIRVVKVSGLWELSDVAAEQDFSKLCANSTCIGISYGMPITFPLFEMPKIEINDKSAAMLGMSKMQQMQINGHAPILSKANERLLGVAGRLATEPRFLSEVQSLLEGWEALSREEKPHFPFHRVDRSKLSASHGRFEGSPKCKWVVELESFLNRWSLVSLVAWHLPNPQEPLLPSMLPVSSGVESCNMIRLLIPLHYPLQGNDGLLNQIADMQKQEAVSRGLPPGIGAVAHAKLHARMLRVIHLETALNSRFERRGSRGRQTVIQDAIAAGIGISSESVKRLRNMIERCRKGLRHTIPKLRED